MLDPHAIEATLTPRTKAIVPVHLFGQLVDLDAVREIARSRSLLVIGDAALAIGGEYHGKMAGTIGDAGCFSMNSRKILSAFGDAGAVVTNREDIAETTESLRDYGKNPASRRTSILDEVELVHEGSNARFDELQAAVLRVKARGASRTAPRDRGTPRRGVRIATAASSRVQNALPPCLPCLHDRARLP